MSAEQPMFDTVFNIFFSPKRAFETVEQTGGFFMPLVTLIVSSIVVSYLYAKGIDFSWLVDKLISDGMAGAPPEQVEQFRKQFTQETFFRDSVVMAGVGPLLLLVLFAGYLAMCAAALGATYSYTRWFAFTCWSHVPVLLSNLSVVAVLAFDKTGRLAPETLDPQALNSVLQYSSSHAWYRLVSLISLPQIWIWIIMIIGFSLWSKRSMPISAGVVMLPYVLYALIF